jgi:hypothetical protein
MGGIYSCAHCTPSDGSPLNIMTHAGQPTTLTLLVRQPRKAGCPCQFSAAVAARVHKLEAGGHARSPASTMLSQTPSTHPSLRALRAPSIPSSFSRALRHTVTRPPAQWQRWRCRVCRSSQQQERKVGPIYMCTHSTAAAALCMMPCPCVTARYASPKPCAPCPLCDASAACGPSAQCTLAVSSTIRFPHTVAADRSARSSSSIEAMTAAIKRVKSGLEVADADRLVILGLLGRGGSGSVFRAEWRGMQVAVKVRWTACCLGGRRLRLPARCTATITGAAG